MKKLLDQMSNAFREFSEKENRVKEPAGLYEPVQYIMGLGGKHMRPLLLLSAIEACGGEWRDGLSAAYGVEMFHNFTLVHDDIMDAAELRRGKSAVHIKYNTNQAILSGDVMVLDSLKYISQNPRIRSGQALMDFIQTGLRVCEGQQLDVDFEQEECPKMEAYLEMIEGKTAVLPAEALRLGARVVGVDSKMDQLMYEYGLNLGMAFQIQDDILDAYGLVEKVGKIIGGDIRQNKKSILYIIAYEHASPEDRAQLTLLFSNDDHSENKVESVMRLFDKYGVREKAEQIKLEYHQLSMSAIRDLEREKVDCSLLKYLSELLLDRSS